MPKIRKILKFSISFLLIFFLIGVTFSSIYLIRLYNKTESLEFIELQNIKSTSYILNNDDQIIKTINDSIDYYVSYDQLNDDFINALISIEDASFFKHDGFDLKRIFASLYNNIKKGKITQGGSTLTQQLAKNLALTNEQSYDRKLNEVILANKIEQKYSKKEILTYYANSISFEGTKYGVNYASHRFFDKDIENVTLPEAAMLAALVKSPTLYNPYNYPERLNERKNLVLQAMYKEKYINETQLNIAKNIHINELLKKNNLDNIAYDNQAYLDIVYKEVYDTTGLDPFMTPMTIHTYLNEEVQESLDIIQKNQNPEITFKDDQQNIAGAVIDNKSGAIIGAIGGRNYVGEKLYNRAYEMRQQPASSIKPILSYALAYQHLNWSSAHVLNDVPTKYKGTNIDVNNVDHTYMGDILIDDALGYSRNTVAVKTLEEVIDKIGVNEVTGYLKKINILDVPAEKFNYSYALGGMYNGVTPIELAGAYSMIANYGVYRKPTTIKYIELQDGTIIENNIPSEQVLDAPSSFLIANTLKNVVNKNYWGIGSVKISNVDIGAKTGTSSFDERIIKEYNYPSNANKDIWFAGFSKEYSMAFWTGFDEVSHETKNYFNSSGDTRVRIPRLIFKNIMTKLSLHASNFTVPDGIVSQKIIKGSYPYLYPLDFIEEKHLINAYFKVNHLPNKTFEVPKLPNLDRIDIYHYNEKMEIHFPSIGDEFYSKYQYGKSIFSLENILGKAVYCLDITEDDETSTVCSQTNIITLPFNYFSEYTINAYYSYDKVDGYRSNYYQTHISLW